MCFVHGSCFSQRKTEELPPRLSAEFQSKTPAEKEAILREDEDWPDDADQPANAPGNDWWSQQPAEAQPTHWDSKSSLEKTLEAMDPSERARFQEAIELDKKGVEADPHTFLDIVPYRRMITSPIEVLKRLIRSTAEGAVVRAAKKGAARWKVGDNVLAPTSKGVEPSWSAQARRHWKNEAFEEGPVQKWGAENVERMKKGLAPQRINPETGLLESKELHHHPEPRRAGGKKFVDVWPDQHAEVDEYRRLKKR